MRKLSNRQKRKMRQRARRALHQPDIIVSSAILFCRTEDGEWVEFGTTSNWKFVVSDEANEELEIELSKGREQLKDIVGQTFTIHGTLSEEATEPLGIIDQLTWGARLN